MRMRVDCREGSAATAPPLCAGDQVQAVTTQGTAVGHRGMVKVTTRVAHTDALHDCSGWEIGKRCERHDFGEPQPRSANCVRQISTPALVCSSVSVAGKYCMTSGSAFMAANGAMWRSCQASRRRRPVSSSMRSGMSLILTSDGLLNGPAVTRAVSRRLSCLAPSLHSPNVLAPRQ